MSSRVVVPPETVQIAEDSLRRCTQEAFFSAFYQRFKASDAVIREKFANTDFDQQNRQLQHGLGLLLIYAKRLNPVLLDRIATRHSVTDLDVPPALYEKFVDCLLPTLQEFDPQYSPAVEKAWRDSLAPGVEFMKRHYAGQVAAQAPR